MSRWKKERGGRGRAAFPPLFPFLLTLTRACPTPRAQPMNGANGHGQFDDADEEDE